MLICGYKTSLVWAYFLYIFIQRLRLYSTISHVPSSPRIFQSDLPWHIQTDRQIDRHTGAHTYSSLLVKFFEGNIIHYNMQLPCNALATIQSFNSFQSCRVCKTCAHWPMQVNAPLRLTKRCKWMMLLEKVFTKHSSCTIELFFCQLRFRNSFFHSSFFLKLYCL